MFIQLAIVLLILWVLGFSFFEAAGWFIHLLLILAVISLLIRIIRGK